MNFSKDPDFFLDPTTYYLLSYQVFDDGDVVYQHASQHITVHCIRVAWS